MTSRVPSFYRRAIPLYVGTIVLPIAVLLWLGLQSFERQHQALATLRTEKLNAAIEADTRSAAAKAFLDRSQPIAKYFFTIEGGAVVAPALHAPPPRDAPAEFADAERRELELNQFDLALASYRQLARNPAFEALALSRMARVLSKLGRDEEARATWRELAGRHPDEYDLSGRPFGIVAAIQAGDTAGLGDRITGGRWPLSKDQAEFFLAKLGEVAGAPRYLDRFRFADDLNREFKPSRALLDGEIGSYVFANNRIFYRTQDRGRIVGFLVRPEWAADLRDRKARELGITGGRGTDVLPYGAAIAVVIIVLSAGAVLLWRDVSREARVNQLRSEFVSGVSHELKTPITLVRLYGETLLRQNALPEADRREFYRIITRESARLGRLVDQIVTFARVERGSGEYDLKVGDVAPVIAGVVDDYSEWLEHAGFAVSRTIPEKLPTIRFDASAVAQAVINLLDNAAKYSGSARHISVRLQTIGQHVQIEVQDHGIGIAAADRERIFERFYRAPNELGKGGYGLGLFMVRHIMDAHGGRVEIDSQPGHGSTFRLAFPLTT